MKAGFRIGILTVLLFSGCAGRETARQPPLSSVVLLIEGVEGDRGPFDFAAAGVGAFQRSEGVRVPLLALGEDPLAWERMIREAAREPAYRLFIVGMEGPARLGLEQARIFPGKQFVLLGLNDRTVIPPNVFILSFNEWEAGWLAGYIAGHLAGQDEAEGRIGRRIGALIGPGPSAALEGYRCGARAAGVRPEDLLVEEVGSTSDPVAGFEAALRLYQEGAEILLGLAGGSSAGLFEAAAAARRYAIGFGVDWGDRYTAMRSPVAEALLGSVTPAIDEAVRRALRQSRRGMLPAGTHLVMGLSNGGFVWRGSPAFFRIAPTWLQHQIRNRTLHPEPCE
ncbi:MAG: BMP family ABC transporter substrate-binding protein [Thermoflexus sp.]|uniref:BMP family ABC transporter substrate-binding protein n=1 Tax=Thermoflexus sp. TaxID=1969742 RepID=UPI0025FF6EF2|nr:BMP family ABC transporter substrate-binding protein [Thermoflexus sp.]MCS6965003.1 BMP family ABC transporter substrate-binding protein [Thermoflexus sp.]MDW8184554.1 BMP family ABC transporter substrate-binding protein [Anaerolineae bacterium]